MSLDGDRRMAAAAAATLLLAAPAQAFDAAGVALGGDELAVKKAFPSAHCKPLEWKSDAADRRCDDGRIAFAGVSARITVYLKSGAVRAYDVRFDTRDLERVKAHLRARLGAPFAETTETLTRGGKDERKVFKMRWENGADHALLSAQLERKRAGLEVWRGKFAEEIYQVK
jgi:hypothetical protein